MKCWWEDLPLLMILQVINIRYASELNLNCIFFHLGITVYTAMLLGRISWPDHVDSIAKDFIQKLLVKDCHKRLGHGEDGYEKIKDHK